MLSNSFPYIAFSLLFFLFSLDGYVFSKNTEAYKSIRFLFVNATVLISIYFIGCRGFVAADWYFYLPYFEKCPTFFDETSKIFEFVKNNEYEKGYCLFSIICKSIFDNYFAFQFICFVIDCFVLHSLHFIYILRMQRVCKKTLYFCTLFCTLFLLISMLGFSRS